MSKYAIGLDIGIASVGWSVLSLNEKEEPEGILNLGVRIFDKAEQPKTGESLAAPRREARSARRRLRRHRHRNERIRMLIVDSGLLTKEELDTVFDGKLEDIYALRAKALDKPVTSKEFARILIHLSQRRGFLSNRKSATKEKDNQTMLKAIADNQKLMETKGYRTVGEMFWRDEVYAAHKRNKGGEYIATISRELVTDETKKIFAAQRHFAKPWAGEDFEEQYLEILLSQRSFEEGPGGDSPYGGDQILKMVGNCTFEKDQLRAAKASYSFELFTLLQTVNHIRIINLAESRPLTADQRKTVVSLAHKKKSLTYGDIRKALDLEDKDTFNISYARGEDLAANEKKTKLSCLQAYHTMKTALNNVAKDRIDSLSKTQRNEIGRIFTVYKTPKKIETALKEANFDDKDIDALMTMAGFSKFGHLSIKACDKIIPYLEEGMTYDKACAKAGYDFKAHGNGEVSRLLKPLDEEIVNITSPVARRAIAQTIKVLNGIIRQQGESPIYINIEVCREMAKSAEERRKLDNENKNNHAENQRRLERLRTEFNLPLPTGFDLVKLKLYEEQGGVCPYSQQQMSITKIFDKSLNYAEVDHIVPYSVSFDDSYKNKVLVLSQENRNKGNRLPLEYLTGEKRNNFIVWVSNNIPNNSPKRRLLLKESVNEEEENGFKERNLQDTKTISRFMFNYINDNLAFAPSETGRKKRVTAVSGAITGFVRKKWGIQKIRTEGDLHHARDAVVIACITDSMIQKISAWSKWQECPDLFHAEKEYEAKKFPYPWPQFRNELIARTDNDPLQTIRGNKELLSLYADRLEEIKPVFISRMPRRKISGAAHKDTVKSVKEIDKGVIISKQPLSSLTLTPDGEIKGYYKPESDRLLYEALKERLTAYGGKGTKAFKEPFYKPKSDGTLGPIVRKVKIQEVSTLSVPVHSGQGAANNEKMVRVDVFYVKGDGYYLVPIYVADTLKETLPNLACVANKTYQEWKVMREEDFIFSLYYNDLIKVTNKKDFILKNDETKDFYETKSALLYYKGTDISKASISCMTHDNSYKVRIGVKRLQDITKYQVDVLGNISMVKKEKRLSFSHRKGK